MKVVIDTSVVVSAVMRDRDPETIILFVVSSPEIEWVVSPPILVEYETVLSRKKFGLPPEILESWHKVFHEVTTLVMPVITFEFPRDQKDAKFLECAISADAEYLLTSDHDFTEAKKLVHTTILSVSQFKHLVCDPLKSHARETSIREP